jgi:hypothetical protein
VTTDEYLVYQTVIRSNWSGQAQIVISATTDIHNLQNLQRQVDDNLPGLAKDTLNSFMEANQFEYPLENRFQLINHVVLFSQSDRNAIFGQNLENGWQAFYQKYPDAQGLLSFSRVGFNRARTQALVYYGNGKGPVDGAGYFVLLAYEGNSWVIKSNLMLFIA